MSWRLATRDIFTTYSKDPARKFDNEERRALQASLAGTVEPELAAARAWIEASPARRRLPARLDRPLTGANPLLLDA